MKNYPQIIKSLIVVCLGILFVQCSKSDEIEKIPIPLFSESDMALIHGNSKKSWHITEVILNRVNGTSRDELDITSGCVADDIYTFSKEKEEVEINYGETLCFENVNLADTEIFTANLEFWDFTQGKETIHLFFSRGYTNADNTFSGARGGYYQLAELTESRMVFTKHSDDFLGKYNDALVFEAIDN